jgi:hypothetical protein
LCGFVEESLFWAAELARVDGRDFDEISVVFPLFAFLLLLEEEGILSRSVK